MIDEMSLLREENERQKIIINALAEKLRQIENLVYSNAEIKDGVNTRILSIEEKIVGVKSLLYSYAKNKDGVNIDNSYTAEKMDGVNSFIYSNAEKMVGVNTNNSYNAEKMDGVKSDNLLIAENKAGVNSNNSAIAEKKVGEKYLNEAMVVSALCHVMVKCSTSSLYSTAKILIQLHNSPRNSYKELRNLTGLSEDGMTKRIMAMKKRGLIVRTAFQQYTLTGKALEVLDKGCAER